MLAEIQGRGWRHFCVKMTRRYRKGGRGKRQSLPRDELRGKGWARHATLEIKMSDVCLSRSRAEPERWQSLSSVENKLAGTKWPRR